MLCGRQHGGRLAGEEARDGGFGEHRDRVFGVRAPRRGGEDGVGRHHRPATRGDVPGELVDLHEWAATVCAGAGTFEQFAGALCEAGVPACLGCVEQ